MAKLMAQGEHFIMGEQGRATLCPRSKVGHDVGHGVGDPCLRSAPTHHPVHPGAAPLALSSEQITAELPQRFAVAAHLKASEIRVIGGNRGVRDELHAKQIAKN